MAEFKVGDLILIFSDKTNSKYKRITVFEVIYCLENGSWKTYYSFLMENIKSKKNDLEELKRYGYTFVLDKQTMRDELLSKLI